MRPLPSLPDFPVVKVAVPPAGLVHRLDLWNLLPPEDGKQLLDYVVLALGDRDLGPEILVASRPSRATGPPIYNAISDAENLVPAAELGLLSADLVGLGLHQGGTRNGMQVLTASLLEGRSPWERQLVRVDGRDVNFFGVSWDGGWLLVGACLDTTVALIGRGIDVHDIELTRMGRAELDQLVLV